MNCHDDVIAYHDEDVTLPQKDRTEMQERRDINRRRLKSGLKRDDEPTPIDCRSQGSYAMRTMVQQPDKDYDIDDGAYFEKEELKGPQGGDKTANDAREMVRKALHDDSFKRPPEKLKNCVRVYYDEGYHVDIPVYRQITIVNDCGEEEQSYELASTDWKRSDPLAVTDWFLEANKEQSPDSDNGGQLRRMVRLLKAFVRSRSSWRERIATGFMITKLVVEKYVSNAAHEDQALYYTMVAIRNRLNRDLEIEHPTVEGEMLTKGPDDGRTKFLLEKLNWAIDELDVLFESGCTREVGLKVWDKVFNTTFFIERLEEDETEKQNNKNSGAVPATVLISGSEKAAAEKPVNKRGGGRYA